MGDLLPSCRDTQEPQTALGRRSLQLRSREKEKGKLNGDSKKIKIKIIMEVAIKDEEWVSGREKSGVISIWARLIKLEREKNRCQKMEGQTRLVLGGKISEATSAVKAR